MLCTIYVHNALYFQHYTVFSCRFLNTFFFISCLKMYFTCFVKRSAIQLIILSRIGLFILFFFTIFFFGSLLCMCRECLWNNYSFWWGWFVCFLWREHTRYASDRNDNIGLFSFFSNSIYYCSFILDVKCNFMYFEIWQNVWRAIWEYKLFTRIQNLHTIFAPFLLLIIVGCLLYFCKMQAGKSVKLFIFHLHICLVAM